LATFLSFLVNNCNSLFVFVLFFNSGVWTQGLYMLNKCSTTWAMLNSLLQ
jgi:hypothetical protein